MRDDASGIDNRGGVANHGTIDWSASTGIVSALYDITGSYSAGNNHHDDEGDVADGCVSTPEVPKQSA